MSNPVVVVVGAGPGVGAAVARRFGSEGYDAGLVARSADQLQGIVGDLDKEGVTAWHCAADVTDATALTDAVTQCGKHSGRIDVLHYNPSVFRQVDPLHLTPQELLGDLHLGVAGLLPAVQAARPYLGSGARIIATGSMAADQPWHKAASLGVQKAGLRNLIHSVDSTLSAEGIRATSLTVHGLLAEDGPFSPARVADALYHAATQDPTDWRTEVAYRG